MPYLQSFNTYAKVNETEASACFKFTLWVSLCICGPFGSELYMSFNVEPPVILTSQ